MKAAVADFWRANQVRVTLVEKYKVMDGFVSVAQYPRGFEADDDEFGMIVRDGEIVERLFSIAD